MKKTELEKKVEELNRYENYLYSYRYYANNSKRTRTYKRKGMTMRDKKKYPDSFIVWDIQFGSRAKTYRMVKKFHPKAKIIRFSSGYLCFYSKREYKKWIKE